jgi:urease accessory protein
MPRRIIAILVMMVAASTTAYAHTGTGIHSGFLHPMLGWDHLLAMMGVGSWAYSIGGPAIWKIPLGFMTSMVVGGVLGIYGVPVPFVELTILASTLVITGLWLLKVRMTAWVGAGVVGVFAIAHGYAHGAEMPMDASPVLFALGFVAATGLLHALGVCLALWWVRRRLNTDAQSL